MSNDILYWSQVDIDRNEYIDKQLADFSQKITESMTSIEELEKKRFIQISRVNESINNTLDLMSDKLFGCSPYNLEEIHESLKKRIEILSSLSEANNLQLYTMKKDIAYIDFDLVINGVAFIFGCVSTFLLLKFLSYL